MSDLEKKVFDELLAASRFLGLDLRDFEITRNVSARDDVIWITGTCTLNGNVIHLPKVYESDNVRKILTQSLLNLLS